MTQIFLEDGKVVPVTVIKTEQDLGDDLINRKVVITGVSKGKGFAGVMKKWNFKGQMTTRGMSNTPRGAGSPGGQTPGRVLPGKKMAGRMGNKTVTVKGSRIVNIDTASKFVMVSGPVPGARKGAIILRVKEEKAGKEPVTETK